MDLFKSIADVTLSGDDIVDNKTDMLDDEVRAILKKMMYIFLVGAVLGVFVAFMVNVFVAKQSFVLSGFAVFFITIGCYSIFTGKAYLKTGRLSVKSVLFINWKGRIIGFIELAVGIFALIGFFSS